MTSSCLQNYKLHNVYLQITCFAMCAIAQGTAFARWRKWPPEEKLLGWQLYGWFTALSCLGSVAGALAYLARIGQLYGIYATRVGNPNSDRNLTPQQNIEQRIRINQLSRDMLRCASAYHALFPLELRLVTTANAPFFNAQISAQALVDAMQPTLYSGHSNLQLDRVLQQYRRCGAIQLRR